ncbi:hypothetical protein ABZS79_07185 [Streptomyces griseoloalbus]|uniref:hypothetical protein n=1 Tax=Streptomyces griseoloalbus TaxID=67303 RepID=UPI0033A7F510
MITASYLWSNDFWNTAITAVVAVAVGVVAALATMKASNPKRGIEWEVHSNQSLIPDSTVPGNNVTITHSLHPHPLNEARIVELKIKNKGRRDIEPGHFTLDNESLVFDFGAPIVTVLNIAVEPSSAPEPDIVTTGSKFAVSKSPIKRGQELAYSVLVNGPESDVKLHRDSILNTPVREHNTEAATFRRIKLGLISITALLAVGGFAAVQSMLDARDTMRSQVQQNRHMTSENRELELKVKRMAECVLLPEQHQAQQSSCVQEADKAANGK